jgi:hypothetical protein
MLDFLPAVRFSTFSTFFTYVHVAAMLVRSAEQALECVGRILSTCAHVHEPARPEPAAFLPALHARHACQYFRPLTAGRWC